MQARIREIVRKMENAIATHQFPEARSLSDQEVQEREKLRQLREQSQGSPKPNQVVRDDIEQATADRAGVPLAAVRRVLADREAGPLETLTKALAAGLPVEHRDWAAALAAHLLACTPDDAERVARTILAVMATRKPTEGGL